MVIYRIRRRAAAGAAGAPATLKSAELAFNENTKVLYYGFGDDGSGNATSIISIGGEGAFDTLGSNQTLSGNKTFSGTVTITGSLVAPTQAPGDNTTKVATTAFVQAAVAAAGGGDMSKAVYDTTANGVVDNSEKLNGQAAAFYLDRTNHTGAQAIATVTGLQAALDAKAPLASPAFTGTPTAPTPAAADNSTNLATTAYVKGQISSLVAGAGAALDTLNELAAALGNDPNFSTTIASSLAGKADTTLSNLSNVATARTNLGLGTMATQNANAVNITGGTIDGVTLDGGTF